MLYVCFVDFKKAFDDVNRLKSWQQLISYKITGDKNHTKLRNEAKSSV